MEPHGGGGIVWFCCFAPSSNALPHSLDLLHWFSHFQEFLSQPFQHFSLLVQRYFSCWFRHFQEFLSQSFHFHSLAPHLFRSFKFFCNCNLFLVFVMSQAIVMSTAFTEVHGRGLDKVDNILWSSTRSGQKPDSQILEAGLSCRLNAKWLQSWRSL